MEGADDKKAHIVNIAEVHFSRQGFEGTSIRKLCKAAGVNVAMINYYFGSKNGLFETLVENRVAFMKKKLRELTKSNNRPAIEKINAIIDAYVHCWFDHRDFYLTLQREISMIQRQKMHGKIIDMLIGNATYIKQIILDGIKKKQFHKIDVEMTIATLLGSIHQTMLSEEICRRLLTNKHKNFNPYKDFAFRNRVITHLQQIMKAYLILK